MWFIRSGNKAMHLILLFVLLLMFSHASADTFFKRGSEGYFWYQDPPPVLEEEAPIAEVPIEPNESVESPVDQGQKTTPFSTAWLRDNIPVLLERAMDSGRREDMEAYLYAQRLALDKAQNFAHLQTLVVSTDPLLDENNRVPFASFIRQAVLSDRDSTKSDVTKYLSEKGGLLMFFDSKCAFCAQQLPLVQHLGENFGFEIRYISVDGIALPGMQEWIPDNGHFQTLNLKLTPTLVYAVPPNDFYVLSQGVMSYNGIIDRLMVVAESERLISDEMITALNPSLRGVARWEDMLDGASDDPAEWVKLLKERLQGRY